MCRECSDEENALRIEILRANYGDHVKVDEYGHMLEGTGVTYAPRYMNVQQSKVGHVRIMQKRTDTVLTVDGVETVEQNAIIYISEEELPELAMQLGDMMLDRIMKAVHDRIAEEENGE